MFSIRFLWKLGPVHCKLGGIVFFDFIKNKIVYNWESCIFVLRFHYYPFNGISVWTLMDTCSITRKLAYMYFSLRGRDYLWRMFFPNECHTQKPTQLPTTGQQRIFRSFDTHVDFQESIQFEILFDDNPVCSFWSLCCFHFFHSETRKNLLN